ncbi:MFS transporter [Kocuria flava]|uniref:MFS transporter n=1 Tax=Kocuria flava TaxID=446860 RepID=A0A2N4SY34_9MICC|nr:MDR family MFS transporter [Kocuria flava]PLC10894.1 MFS transporter [Kocuria flava]
MAGYTYMLASTIGLPIYGKLGDLFGRKVIFVFAIAVFLLGSVLCGLAQDMTQLIIYRALQGVGGGGLMIGAQAIIAELVSPRERGKYMGMIGAAFGLASISGPLLGGFITDAWDWRWVFYINVPLGAVALVVIISTLQVHKPESSRPRLDYAGTGLLAAVSAAIILITSWGGNTYAWNSPVILGLAALSLVALAGFIAVERRAAEPVMPLTLFRDRNFTLPTLIGITVGIAMFATISYLPTFLQMVNGASATASGLMMLPMTAGMLTATIGTGQLISHTGRYKIYILLGPVIITAGLVMLSRISAESAYAYTSAGMFVVGLGVGCLMQNLLVIVQNSVARKDMGTATSATNYFRQIGASFGIAMFGSVFIGRLDDQMGSLPPGGPMPAREAGISSLTPDLLASLPPQVQQAIVGAFAEALPPVFLLGVPVVLVGLILAFFIQEVPLSDEPGHAQAPAQVPVPETVAGAGRPGGAR